ncbi:unnamed protein product, partial [Mesorhabditis spiculigera]
MATPTTFLASILLLLCLLATVVISTDGDDALAMHPEYRYKDQNLNRNSPSRIRRQIYGYPGSYPGGFGMGGFPFFNIGWGITVG